MKVNIFLISILIYMFSGQIFGADLPGPLVESDWLARNLNQVTVLDVREDLKSFTSRAKYIKDKKSGKIKLVAVGGHIPDARLVNYKKVRSTRTINGNKITRLIPEKKDFESVMQASGLNKDDTVVITSKGESNADMTMATRLYWQLKYFGHTKLAILNGGMAQWILDKNKVNTKAATVKRGNWVTRTEDKSLIATSAETASAAQSGETQLIDTRQISLYLGTWNKSYVLAKGHIPGAKNYPNELLTDSGIPAKFISKKQTTSLFSALGIEPNKSAITYCNSGHLASGSWFLLHEILGNKNVKLYDGSMHQWTVEKRPTQSIPDD